MVLLPRRKLETLYSAGPRRNISNLPILYHVSSIFFRRLTHYDHSPSPRTGKRLDFGTSRLLLVNMWPLVLSMDPGAGVTIDLMVGRIMLKKASRASFD